MRVTIFSILVSVLLTNYASAERRVSSRPDTGMPINSGWMFLLEDIPNASGTDYDDSGWRQLDLPHDWAFENGFSEDGAQTDKGGYACGGIGWYRRHLIIKGTEGKRMFLDFDGVYMNSEVWINGHYLGKRPYGYISLPYKVTHKK